MHTLRARAGADTTTRMSPRRLLGLPVGALLALILAAPASAAAFHPPRIVNGTAAAQGEYPAQGFLLIEDDPTHAGFDAFCGGTLVGSRQFLTAAHCATQDLGGGASVPLPANSFLVRMGNVDRRVTDGRVHGDEQRRQRRLQLGDVPERLGDADAEPARPVHADARGR